MRLQSLSKYFPQPKFLNPPHVGISFSDTSIKAVSFGGRGSKDLKVFVVPLEKGAIAEGIIVNPEEVTKKLSIVRNNFNLPFVFFTVSDEISFVFSVEVPVLKESNLAESIAFTMEENVPLPLVDVVFDFLPLKVVRSGVENMALSVVAAAVKRETSKFVTVLQKAGFEPVGCIHESQAIADAVVPRGYKGSAYIVHARGNRIGIHLVRDGSVFFSTIRSVSGDYKKEFLDEYEKFIEYCSRYEDSQSKAVAAAFVCGEFEYAKSSAEALMDLTDRPREVKLASVWTNTFNTDKYVPDIPFEKSLSFAGAVGAALSSII